MKAARVRRANQQVPRWVIVLAVLFSGTATAWAMWETGLSGSEVSWQQAQSMVGQIWVEEQNLEAGFVADGNAVQFVSISVDPKTDTPERLAAYAEKHGADTSRWHFLTAPREEVDRVGTEGFKLGSAGAPIFHSTRFALVDGRGWIRGYYDGMVGEEVSALHAAIEVLLKEPKR